MQVLPSGRSVTYELQATVTALWYGPTAQAPRTTAAVGPLALVNGRVLAVGDELVPGVRINWIGECWLGLVEVDCRD